jgi:protein arginine kinase activator
MKCQQCEKPATFHITELTGGQPQELHFCESCAKTYLMQGDGGAAPAAPTLANVLAKQLQLGKAAEELAKLDQRSCPVCGITFYEFRNQGRLGCPHDYVHFEKELTPLIANIHGESRHVGKRPRGHDEGGSDQQSDLIRLRREMKEAVEKEDYEKASGVRDQIRQLEEEKKKKKRSSSPAGQSQRGAEASGEGEERPNQPPDQP